MSASTNGSDGVWISVTERLPKNDKRVLIAYRPGAHARPDGTLRKNPWQIMFSRYSGGQWRFLYPGEKTRKSERVRYWMPFPKVPKSPQANSKSTSGE